MIGIDPALPEEQGFVNPQYALQPAGSQESPRVQRQAAYLFRITAADQRLVEGTDNEYESVFSSVTA